MTQTTTHGSVAAITQTYTFDSVNRLEKVVDPLGPQTFSYDRYGNRALLAGSYQPVEYAQAVTVPTDSEAEVGAKFPNNRMLGATADLAGNITLLESRSLTYDGEGRITKVASAVPAKDWRYDYDGEGRPVRQVHTTTAGSDETDYVYDAAGQLLADYAVAGNTIAADGLRYVTSDWLGSTRLVTDAAGAPVSRHDYLPFGEEIRATGAGPRQKFTGKERENYANIRLDYFGARYYGAGVGRWTSPDPFNPILRLRRRSQFDEYLSQPQNWNAYVYTWNNPLRHTDPSGESVYVVLYTQGNSHGDEELRRAAQTRAEELRQSKGFDASRDQVIVQGVVTKDDFRNALTTANAAGAGNGGVKQVNLFSHSGRNDGPVFHDRQAASPMNPNGAVQFSASELRSLPAMTWAPRATAIFCGCNTATFAGQFAAAQRVESFGTTGFAYFSSRPDRFSPINRDGNVYLIDTLFSQYFPRFLNFTGAMERHQPR